MWLWPSTRFLYKHNFIYISIYVNINPLLTFLALYTKKND